MRISRAISTSQSLGIFDISDESKVRIIVQEAGPSNTLIVRGRLKEQPNFIELYTITGSVNQVINIFTYEEIQIECTVCEPTVDQIKVYAASFSEAGGSAIDSIDVPSGDSIKDFNSLSLTSDDGSIAISGDNVLKSIDFSTESSLIPFTQNVPTDWAGTTSTIADAADQLAERTKSLEINKIDSTEKGSPDGVVPLNNLSKIDSIYLPSYVDDVEEYSSLTTFPLVGESSKIYVALDTNKVYRWSGSLYIEISEALVTSVNGDVGDVLIPIDEKVDKIGDVMSGSLSVSVPAAGTSTLGWQGVSSQSADFTQSADYTLDGAAVTLTNPGVTQNIVSISSMAMSLIETDLVAGVTIKAEVQSGQLSLTSDDGTIITPMLPTQPKHVTTKAYVDDQDALKEDVANKSIDGTLASNSDTLYPSEKAVKTYADSVASQIQSKLDASTYYHELHVNYDFTGTTSDGSPYKPFKTTQAAVNAAQLQNIGGNTAILIHLKNDVTVVENITVNNAVSNLYIMPAVRNNTSSGAFKIIGSLTISGASTNRVRVQDIEFVPTSGYALIINDTPGRHLFQNCGFINGSIAGQAGTGVNLTSTYRNFIEFVDCTIEGTLNIAGTPAIGTTLLMYRCKLGYANVIVNSPNIAVGMYDTYGIYGITHTAGALGITGMWGIAQAGFFNSTATLTATNILSLSNVSLQKPDLSFVALNKTGTCFYQLMNVHRGETADVLTGTRTVFGPTATDAGYKMGVSANWSPSVSSVAPALDQLVQRVKNSETSSGNTTTILNDTKEPTGFINRTDSTISFVDGTRIFTIAPVTTSFDFYIKGTKFTKSTAQDLTIPNLSGNHYIYFDTAGALQSTQVFSPDIIEIYSFVAVIYWNAVNSSHTYFGDERHGITMDGATHIYLHTVFGAQYILGLALEGFSVDGTGDVNSDAQFTSDSGAIRDEDIYHTILAQAQIPILHRIGQLWNKKTADAYPIIYSGTAGYTGSAGRLPYNELNGGGSWQLTEVTSTDFVLVHFFATNDKENPVIGIQGIAKYGSPSAARTSANSEISQLTGLPFTEFVAIGSVIFQTSTAYTNIPKGRVRSTDTGSEYVDFRGTQLYSPAGTATDHGLLSGLADDDHIQYHTDSRADSRYYTKSQIDSSVVYKNGTTPFAADQSMAGFKLTNLADPVALTDAVNLQTLNSSLGSSNDLVEKSFPVYDEETTAVAITDFSFANSTARSFNALVSVRIQASSNLSETFEIRGIQKDSDWHISITSEGDYSKVIFSIDSSGQMYYVSGNYAGFIDGVIKFRAITTSV
jgi:hypothetical protein